MTKRATETQDGEHNIQDGTVRRVESSTLNVESRIDSCQIDKKPTEPDFEPAEQPKEQDDNLNKN